MAFSRLALIWASLGRVEGIPFFSYWFAGACGRPPPAECLPHRPAKAGEVVRKRFSTVPNRG